MNPRIDEAALAAAWAGGPNPRPLGRLRAAAEYAAGHASGAQLGSPAQGEVGPKSDFDFLGVHPAGCRITTTKREKRNQTNEAGSSTIGRNEAKQ